MRCLWFVMSSAWFGCIGRLICASDIHIVYKTLLFIGDLVISFYNFIVYYNESE